MQQLLPPPSVPVGALGALPNENPTIVHPSTVEQTPPRSSAVDPIEVTPGGKAGALILNNFRGGEESRRGLTWSTEDARIELVASRPRVGRSVPDQLRLLNQPFNAGPPEFPIDADPQLDQEVFDAQVARKIAAAQAAREAEDARLAAEGGARGGFQDYSSGDLKRNRGDWGSSGKSDFPKTKRVKK